MLAVLTWCLLAVVAANVVVWCAVLFAVAKHGRRGA